MQREVYFQKNQIDVVNREETKNRPFPSSPGPLFQNEGRCSAFDMEIIFHSHANKTHFHKKGFAPCTMRHKNNFIHLMLKTRCEQKTNPQCRHTTYTNCYYPSQFQTPIIADTGGPHTAVNKHINGVIRSLPGPWKTILVIIPFIWIH